MQTERKRILDMLKDGRLSTEEALTLLEALDRETEDKGSENKEEKTFEGIKLEKETESRQDPSREDRYRKEDKKAPFEDPISQLSGARDKILDFVNTAIKKFKDFDLQLNQSVEFPHVFQHSDTLISKIDIDVANGHVEIKPWDQQDIRVECQVKVYRTDDREEARNSFIKNSYYSVEGEKLRFTTQSKWMKVDTVVYVPRQSYEKASIRTFNGRITGEQLHAQDLKVKTANGKILLIQMEAEKAEAETANGKISITDSRVSKLAAETMNGSLDVTGNYQFVDLQSFNGNITCTLGSHEMDTIHTKAVTGNITIELPGDVTVEGECKSNLGNYKIDLPGYEVLDEKKEMVQKQLRFKRNGSIEEPIRLFADTKTGSIYVK